MPLLLVICHVMSDCISGSCLAQVPLALAQTALHLVLMLQHVCAHAFMRRIAYRKHQAADPLLSTSVLPVTGILGWC